VCYVIIRAYPKRVLLDNGFTIIANTNITRFGVNRFYLINNFFRKPKWAKPVFDTLNKANFSKPLRVLNANRVFSSLLSSENLSNDSLFSSALPFITVISRLLNRVVLSFCCFPYDHYTTLFGLWVPFLILFYTSCKFQSDSLYPIFRATHISILFPAATTALSRILWLSAHMSFSALVL